MLCKIIVTFLIAIMGVVDGFGYITGLNVCDTIDHLNEAAYAIEDHLN